MGFRSFVLLAFYFWRHVLKKLTFRYDRGGATRFIDNYEADRLLPVPGEVRSALPSWHGCIGCGICDAEYPDAGVSVMNIVASGMRDFSTMPYLSSDAAKLSDVSRLEAASRACPTSVPIPDVVAFIASASDRLEAAVRRPG